MKHPILLLLFMIVVSVPIFGQITGQPDAGKKMTFQGSLFQNGEPFDGTTKLKFTIALDSSSWTETHESVTVINGLYSVVLGQFTPLPNSLFYFTDERSVRVEVDDVVLGNVKLYAPFESKSERDNRILLFDNEQKVKAEMSVWSGQGFLNVDGPDDRSNIILSGNYYDAFGSNGDSSALNHGIIALFGPGNGPGEQDHLRLLAGSRGDGSANDATPFLEMKAVDQNTGELSNLANLFVNNFKDTTSASVLKRGQLNLRDTRGMSSNLRSDQLYFFNSLNTQYPAGWYGTIRGSGFAQQVGYDADGTIVGAILTGFWDQDRPGLWMEDANANMGAHLYLEQGTGRLQLNGHDWNTNIQMGAKNWENANLPFMVFRGELTQTFVNDNGTPDDNSDDFEEERNPDLIWMDVQKWQDGTEVGNLTLRGTDGSEFGINSHGINNLDRLEMKDTLGRTGLIMEGRESGGGRVNFPNAQGQNWTWIQNRILTDGSSSGSTQVANIDSEGNYITGTGASGGYMYIDKFTNDRFVSSFEAGLTSDDNKLPFLHFKGNEEINWTDDNGTPEDTSDDTSGSYLPDLLEGVVEKWDDGTEIGALTLRGSDGSEFRLNSHGIQSNQVQVGPVDGVGTYTQQQTSAFRIKNDADPFSSVFLNRSGDGSARMQLVGHNEGVVTGTTFIGTSLTGPYMFMNGPLADGSANTPLVDLYTTGNTPDGVAYTNNYKRAGIDFYDNEGARLAALGSRRDENGSDPTGASGLVLLWGKDNVPNVEMSGKVWENAKLPILQLFGETTDGGTWYHASALIQINSNGTDEWGQLVLKKSNMAGQSTQDMINLDGNDGSAHFAGNVEAERIILPKARLTGDWGSGNGGLTLLDANGVGRMDLAVYDEGDGHFGAGMFLGNSTNNNRVNLSGDGFITVNDGTNDVIALNSQGQIFATSVSATTLSSSDGLVQSSDKRFKKDVKQIDNALSKTLELNGYTYFWNKFAQKKNGVDGDSEQIGVIAQELEEVFPQLVKTDKDGYKAVNYAALSAVLIEAIKELNVEIEKLKTENTDLKAELTKSSELESRLAQIEKLLGVAAGEGSNAINK